MKKIITLLLFIHCLTLKSYAQKVDTLELNQLIRSLTHHCFADIKGSKRFDTANIVSVNSKTVLRGTFDNSINIGKDSTNRNNYTPCNYSAVIGDSLSENEAKLLTRKWKKMLHTYLDSEQAVLYSNDYGFDFEPLKISYGLQKDNIELMVWRTQYEDRKYWVVGLYLAKRAK